MFIKKPNACPCGYCKYIKYFEYNEEIEGLVFWKDGKPQCKIKRIDFGLEWKGGLE